MKLPFALALVLIVGACGQQKAPADEIAEAAEEIIAPVPSAPPMTKGRFAPRDTCVDIDGASGFRQQLARAVERRDANLLVGLAANDIKLDFGGGAGTAELGKRLADPSWALWDELAELLAMGCAGNAQGGITIPWVFEQDFGTADPFMTMLVTGEDVPVLAAPDPEGARLGTISWDLVDIAALQPDAPYQSIRLPDGAAGFIATGNLRSLVDYRLVASSRNGRWRITSLLAGD